MENNGTTELLMVTPSLNQARYIRATIDSVLHQIGPDDLYVIVDGGSTDGTLQILEDYKDQRLRIHINSGQSQAAALEFAFAKYSGSLCAYLNTDDFLLPGAIDQVKQTFRDEIDVDAVYSHRVTIDEHNQVTGLWVLPSHSNYLMSRWDYIPQETTFWRRSAMASIGNFDGDLDFAVDYEFFVRLMKSHQMVRKRGHFATFRSHSQSKTNTINDSVGQREVAAIQQKYGLRIRWYDRIIGRLLRHWIEYRSNRALTRCRGEIQSTIDAFLAPGKG